MSAKSDLLKTLPLNEVYYIAIGIQSFRMGMHSYIAIVLAILMCITTPDSSKYMQGILKNACPPSENLKLTVVKKFKDIRIFEQ